MFVTWKQRALDRLADIYVTLTLPEQRQLAAHVEWVNRELTEHAWELGESRGADRRIWFTDWLVVSYFLIPGGGASIFFVSNNRR